MVDWSEAFGNVPVLLHADDRDWISRPSANLELWSGPINRLSASVTLYHCPGHFPGSTLLHWADGPGGHQIVLAGDTLHVAQDRRHVSFVYSVPNHVPLGAPTVLELRRRLADVQFDDLYGFTWGLNILGDARRAVDESFDRHLRAVAA
jgi:glyoxylase-like metal-dependent hydrolase (beta-lactamase superfamily II)